MVKKIFVALFLCLMISISTSAKPLTGEINFVWDKISQTEREADIAAIQSKIFSSSEIPTYTKEEFTNSFKNFKKDKKFRENMICAGTGLLDLEDRILVPFYYKTILYGYGIIYKNDLKHCYYYNAIGRLFIVETFLKNYNDYPVISYHYNRFGKAVAGIYANSSVDDYIYSAEGKFLGRWYKENFYDLNGNIKMQRILPKN